MYGYDAQRTSCLAGGSDAVVHAGGAIAGSLSFSAPWPNPASGTSSFRFSLPVGGPARLEVSDVTGRRIREWLKREMVAGAHELHWDGRRSGRVSRLRPAPSPRDRPRGRPAA
jgi:hypothetical protein